MKKFLKEKERSFVEEEVDNLAREGLRTLVVCAKVLENKFFQK